MSTINIILVSAREVAAKRDRIVPYLEVWQKLVMSG